MGKKFIELLLAEDRTQRGLRELRGLVHVIGNFDHSFPRLDHAQEDDGVYLQGDVVARDNVLRRHFQSLLPQGDANHAIKRGEAACSSATEFSGITSVARSISLKIRLGDQSMCSVSLRHPEGHVALERSLGCRHLDRASGRTSWYVGRDQGSRDHFEDRLCAVKRDVGCAGQIRSQNLDSRSHLAGGRLCYHKRAQTYRQAVDRPIALRTFRRSEVGKPARATRTGPYTVGAK